MYMRIISSVTSFPTEAAQFDFLIPLIEKIMPEVIESIAHLGEPPIKTDNIIAVHFTENYQEELFQFQKSVGHRTFTTDNKIASGYAQVITVEEQNILGEEQGYHIFFDKYIPMTILIGQYCENNSNGIDVDLLNTVKYEKNKCLRSIRHELAHVEDSDNQRTWIWLKDSFNDNSVKTTLRYVAFRLWEEYYACRRSGYLLDVNDELVSLIHNLDKAEQEICDLRWQYNIRQISLEQFIRDLHEYIKSAFIYCCYFMGHADGVYDVISPKIESVSYPSRFYPYIKQLWDRLRFMTISYPAWDGPEIFDDLANIVLASINDFDVYPEDTDNGPYYSIPPKKLFKRGNANNP